MPAAFDWLLEEHTYHNLHRISHADKIFPYWVFWRVKELWLGSPSMDCIEGFFAKSGWKRNPSTETLHPPALPFGKMRFPSSCTFELHEKVASCPVHLHLHHGYVGRVSNCTCSWITRDVLAKHMRQYVGSHILFSLFSMRCSGNTKNSRIIEVLSSH